MQIGRGRRSGLTTAPEQLSPLEALAEAASLRPVTFARWRGQLITTNFIEINSFVDRVPAERLSPLGKHFTRELLAHNYGQVLNLKP
jgi:hypothetical protein